MTDDPPAGGNVEVYSMPEEVDQYEQMAYDGLFPREEKLFDQYPPADGLVLDLGCGVGRTTTVLDEQGADVVGVDISEEAIGRARHHFPDLEFQIGDAAALSFRDETFEYVLFLRMGLDYTHPEVQRHTALAEIHRVLKPGGWFAFSSRNAWYTLPALAIDHSWIDRFYATWPNPVRIGRRYKLHVDEHGALLSYFSNPFRQRRQLRDHDFELVDIIGKLDGPLQYFDPIPHFVARKA